MARKRPAVSHATQRTPTAANHEQRSVWDARHRPPLGPDVVVTEELVAIVVRASQLGFSPWRVGIALRVPPMELAWICTRPQADASTAKTLTATLHGASWHSAVQPAGDFEQRAPRG